MLKELRSWFQMLDGIMDGTDGIVTVAPQPAAEAQPGLCGTRAPDRSLAFILDSDDVAARSLAARLSASGLDTVAFPDCRALMGGLDQARPQIIFVDVRGEAGEAIETLRRLDGAHYQGAVQLMGPQSSPVLEALCSMGSRHALSMLAPLGKPVPEAALQRLLAQRQLGTAASTPAVSLGDVLGNDWLDFWYQPKIDLKKRQIAGVETFARVRHPQLGALLPGDFMAGAGEDERVALSERALEAALKAASRFSQLGINLRLAVNMPIEGLLNLPIRQMVETLGPKHHKWPGLLLDVTEAQITQNLAEVQAVSRGLTACGVHLAIDDFGGKGLSLAALRSLPIAELKLDRAFVADCAVDLKRSTICHSVIDLARLLGCLTVGVGVEKAGDMMVLQSLGCDLGQGHLFSQPMPEDMLVDSLLQRAVAAPPRAASRPAQPLTVVASAPRRVALN